LTDPPLGRILTSEQARNVSWGPQPSAPVPLEQVPHRLPVV
jgi:hypothetical protein